MKVQPFNLGTFIKGGLLVVSAVLSLLLAVEFSRVHVPASRTVDTKNSAVTNGTMKQESALQDINFYAEITQRPLFHEDRRPFVYVPPPLPVTPPVIASAPPVSITPPPQLQLMATIITPETRVAILKSQTVNKPQRLRVGDPIEGWSIAEIREHEIIIQQGTNTHVIELKVLGANKGLQTAPP